MTGKNYLNQSDRERFGFRESGEFNAPYKYAHIFAALFISAGIIVDVIVFFALVEFGHGGITGGVLFDALFLGVIMLFTVAATVVVAGLCVRFISSGFKCSYTADDEKFTLTYGSKVHTFYYDDVQTVHFMERMSLGKVFGYDVTIKINGAEENFSIVSEAYISEKTTPFHIIRERIEILRNERESERAMIESASSVYDNSPIFAADIAKVRERKKSVFDRMSDLYGNDADMPAQSAPVIPNGSGDGVSMVIEKVSPTVGGYGVDMPALGKEGGANSLNDTYIAEDGRQIWLDDVQGHGTFHVAMPEKIAAVLWIIVGILLAWTCLMAFIIVQTVFVNARFIIVAVLSDGAMGLPALIAAIIIIKYIRQGKEMSYRANGREFVVSEKKKPDKHIFYDDVAGVTYSKLKFLWFDNGYMVEITTNYGVIKYNYVYPKFRLELKTEDLPFELIRKNAERLKNK